MATGAPRKGFLSRLLPASGSDQFFDLLERHADRTREAAALLAEMLSKEVDLERQAERVKTVEHEGDEITHAVIERLHQTFITPIDRDDMHRLISRMDDVLDLIEASSERIWLYELQVMTPETRDLADVLVRSTEELQQALRLMRDLKNASAIVKRCIDVNRLENEADAILRAALARLFKEEKDPIIVIKWKEVYENLENATDRCEDVANIIEGVVLEHA